MPDVLLDLARGLGGNIAAAVPYKTYDEMLRAAFVPLRKRPGSITGADDDDDFWGKVQDQGGWWNVPASGFLRQVTDRPDVCLYGRAGRLDEPSVRGCEAPAR